MGSVSIHQIIYVCLRDRRLNDLYFVVVVFFVVVFVCGKAAKHTDKKKTDFL